MDIESIKQTLESEIKTAASFNDLEPLKAKYLGRKGVIAKLTSSIPALPQEQRGEFGRRVNELKRHAMSLFAEKQKQFAFVPTQEKQTAVDITLPGVACELGHIHPITQIIEQICDMFRQMGFSVIEGNEIETEYSNFTGLNIPLEHPSREAFDTFYLNLSADAKEGRFLLRSQTSTEQIRAMKANKPPLAVVAPGRVYRPDAVDASHSFMFHQIEGFIVDDNITFADLKGVLEFFAKGIFGQDIKMRFRPHFFPFTEPSAEVDISCIMCRGKGCPVCGRKGWLEILGSGMIHPNVLRNVGYDPGKFTGFAFGMGVERIAMLKYGISDIRLFCENDLRFLKQF